MTQWRECCEGFYEISDAGDVRRRVPPHAGRLLKPRMVKGYYRVTVCVHSVPRKPSVHSLVAEAFIGPRPAGLVINHKDGVKTNNSPNNLEYCTVRENAYHASRNGLSASGDRHFSKLRPERVARGEQVNTAVLSEESVREMRRLRASGVGLTELSRRFGIWKNAVWMACTRRTWRHVA